jgi:hypothetical protein
VITNGQRAMACNKVVLAWSDGSNKALGYAVSLVCTYCTEGEVLLIFLAGVLEEFC